MEGENICKQWMHLRVGNGFWHRGQHTYKIWQNLWKNQLGVKFRRNKEREGGEHREESRRRLPKCSFFSDRHRADGSGTCSTLRNIRVTWALLSLSGGGTQRGENIQDNGLWHWRAPHPLPQPSRHPPYLGCLHLIWHTGRSWEGKQTTRTNRSPASTPKPRAVQ